MPEVLISQNSRDRSTREDAVSRTIALDLVTLDLKIGAEEKGGNRKFALSLRQRGFIGDASLHRWEQTRVLKIGSFDLWRSEDETVSRHLCVRVAGWVFIWNEDKK